jgi:putative flippase GtrA
MLGFETEFIYRILKFGTVGLFCFFIDLAITYLFKEKFRFNKFTANAIGFLVSVVINFTLNRIWTFQSTTADVEMQFMKFITITSFALIINSIIIYLLNVKIRFNFYLSKVIAVFVVMFYNYSMSALFTFTNEANK